MTRSLPEWIGKTADSAIPPRVHVRVFVAAAGKCAICKNDKARGYETDHIVPLILGGEHRETNLQLLCVPCHAGKTKLDVKLKTKVARVRKRHLGIKKPRTMTRWRRFDGSIVQAERNR